MTPKTLHIIWVGDDSLRPPDDSLLQRQAFACRESEIARPGLIAAGYFACRPGDPLVGRIVADIHDAPSVVHDSAWKTVGPQRLTDVYRRCACHALAALAPHASGRLFSRLDDIESECDLVLVPEVLEHVSDVGAFLAGLQALKAAHYVITVPDTFVEIVHPDHNCWYTPFTLSNVIAKYTPWTPDGLWFFNGMSLLAVASKPVAVAACGSAHA